MTVHSHLDTLRLQNASIDAVVYLDVQAKTVLGASSQAGRRQEELDGLCQMASGAFGLAGQGGEQVIVLTVTELTVLQRVPSEEGAALCFFFPPETASAQARAIARQAAEQVRAWA